MVLGQALLLVHDRLRLVDHPVEVLVVPVHEDARRLEERAVHGLGVHRVRAPADEPHRPRLVHVDHVVQVVHPLVRPERGLDAGLVELARDRLGDFLVAHVAALRPVQRDLDAARVAGLRQELLGVGHVKLRRLEPSSPVKRSFPPTLRSILIQQVEARVCVCLNLINLF